MKNALFFLFLLHTAIISAQWTPQNSGTSNYLNQIYFLNADSGYVVQDNGVLRRTINGGTNWDTIYTGNPRPFRMAFTSFTNGHAVGDHCILKSIDGGFNWTTQYTNSNLIFWQICFPKSNIGYVTASAPGDSSVLFKTIDGGNTWFQINSESNLILGFNAMWFPSPDTGYIVVDGEEHIAKTFDGGITLLHDTLPTIMGNLGVHFRTPTEGIVTSYYGEIFRTTDAGNTWMDVTDPGNSLPLYDAFFVNSNTGWVVGGDGFASGVILKTVNGGSSWSNTSGLNGETFNSIYFPTSNVGYTCGLGGVIRKYDEPLYIEQLMKIGVSIYPNPTTGGFNVECRSENVELKIYDVMGKAVHEQKLRSQLSTVNCQLSAGVYFVELSEIPQGGMRVIQKLIVQ